MSNNNEMKYVYTGLNKKMVFKKFTSYFNMPISTTMSIDIAKRFAGDDGVILYLAYTLISGNTSKLSAHVISGCYLAIPLGKCRCSSMHVVLREITMTY